MEASDFRHITWTRADGVAVVRIRFAPRYDYAEYDDISRELRAVTVVSGKDAVLINLDSLELFSSRLLGIFLAAAKQLAREGRTLSVCRLRPGPLRVFKLCRADALIASFASEEEAREFLGA